MMEPLYSKEQVENANAKLTVYLSDKNVLNGSSFQGGCNTNITKDFSEKSLKRVNIADIRFVKSSFIGVAGTGSKFTNTIFRACDFTGANFQYCQFDNVIFDNQTIVKGANFSHSVFIDCRFDNITIIKSTLYDCYFENCKFFNSTINTNTLENTTLQNSFMQNIDLSHMNLEYMKFDNLTMENVTLPPYQIPYIIGAPKYLKSTQSEIYVYTDNGNISMKEYSNMYQDLAAYFYGSKKYFPLANLLVATQKNDEAYECIRLGMEEACDYFDFRMIKHYCRLACSNTEFTNLQLKALFNHVVDLSYNKSWDINTLHFYMINIGEIKELLLNNSENKERVEFIVKTNIDKNDLVSVNELYNQINRIIRENCSTNHVDSIELRHNSPYELYITCIDNLPNVLLFVSAMYSLFAIGNKGLDFLKKIEDTIRVHQQNKLFKYELEEKKLEIELKKKELNQNENKLVIAHSVIELEHYLKCSSTDIAKNITPEYLHNKISNNLK